MRIQVNHDLSADMARQRLERLAGSVRAMGLDLQLTEQGGWFSGRGVRGSLFVSAWDVVVDIEADDLPSVALQRIGATVERRLQSALRRG